MKVLVTGGAGYIGSHTCVELLTAGYDVVVVDNLSNSSLESLRRVEQITSKSVSFVKADICDRESLEAIFSSHQFDAVVHFAGLKAVGESVSLPLKYYHNNVYGTLTLCEVMGAFDVTNLVFSSSATVYGDPASLPIQENFPTSATNPYGRSKLMVEEVLTDLQKAQPGWNIVLLRYFNPIGAHESGLIGEDPDGIPNNLLPFVSQVAVGKLPELSVFGDDYDTVDGTGVRDYIHVVDLAKGHLKALEKITESPGLDVYNLGTGTGYSVLEIISAFERASGKTINYRIAERRPGDIASCYADPSKAADKLNWQAEYDMERMVSDGWRWQSDNPSGYST